MLQNPFFSTIFEKKRTHVPPQVAECNAGVVKQKPSEWSPLERLDNKLNIPRKYDGPLLVQYFDGCRDPVCSSYIGSEPCTANIKIIVSNDGLTCSFAAKGRHCPLYKPVHRHLVQRPDAKQVISKNIGDSVRVIASKLHEQVADYPVPPRAVLSQIKYNWNRSERLNYSNPLGGAIQYLLKSENWILLLKINEREVEQMSNDDFTLVMLHKQTWLDCCNTMSELVGLDGLWKSLRLAHIDKDSGKIPMYVMTCLDPQRRTQVPAIMISTEHKATTWQYCIEAIAERYLHDFKTEWLPVFMVDDGAVEKAALTALDAEYFICKFHVLQAWERQLVKLKCTVKQKAELYRILLEMFSTATETQYNNLYAQLKRIGRPTFGSFVDYFTANWHAYNGEKFFLRWTCINRPSSYGLFNTNNATERIMRDVQEHLNHKACKNVEEYVKAIDNWITLRKLNQQRIRKSQTDRDAEERLARGQALWELRSEDADAWYGSASAGYVRFFNSTVDGEAIQYTTDLYSMTCNCADFIQHSRPCKHLYCSMLAFAHENESNLSEKELKDPFELQHQIALRIHKDAVVNNGSRTTSYPSIRIGAPKRTSKATLLREELRKQTAERRGLSIVDQSSSLRDAEVCGFRFNGRVLEIRVITEHGAKWSNLIPAIDDAFGDYIDELKAHLKKIVAKPHSSSTALEATAVISRDEEYFINTLEHEDIPLSGATKKAVEQLLNKLAKGKSKATNN